MKDWLLHNPIADLPGPQFLTLYALAIAALMVEALWRRSRRDAPLELGVPTIPVKPDPAAIAYLRGGVNEVTRLVVFDLIRRGFLATKIGKGPNGTKIVRADDPPPSGKMDPMEGEALAYFANERAPSALFHHGGLTPRIDLHCEPIRDALREEELIPTEDDIAHAARQWYAATGLVLLVGGYKVAVALAKERHNVIFLLMIGLVGLVALTFAYHVPRLTRRGKAYLLRLRLAYAGLKPQVVSGTPSSADEGDLLLVSSVFGMNAMAGGPHDDVSTLFHNSAASGGSCGASCGGGGGGGGCGGGGGGCGGGCGGGGCGGCGG